MPTFTIVRADLPEKPQWLHPDSRRPFIFQDGEIAKGEARYWSRSYGYKLAVKVIKDSKWVARERERFNSGEYTRLPWVGMDFWYHAISLCPDIEKVHFPHASKQKPGYMAYTASEEDGTKDKQTVIRPSKYLERYCKQAMADYRLDVRRLANQFAQMYAPAELKFASTAKEIAEVYMNGPDSCMSHAVENYATVHLDPELHPTEVYAAGDLQVAYLASGSDDELDDEGCSDTAIIARALVWPKRKTHSRIYGDVHKMDASLKALGYKFDPPIGAKLVRIPLKGEYRGRFVAPYIDAGTSTGGGSMAVEDRNDHLVIVRKSEKPHWPCSETSGATGVKQQAIHCSHCGELTRNDRRIQVRLGADEGDFREVCHDCIHRVAYQSRLDGVWYDKEVYPPVVMDDGRPWTQAQFEEYGSVCAKSGKKCRRDQMIRMFNGQMWSNRSAADYAFQCNNTRHWYPNTERVLNVRGYYVSRQSVRLTHFQCADCTQYEEVERRYECSDSEARCRNCGPHWQRYSMPSYQQAAQVAPLHSQQGLGGLGALGTTTATVTRIP